MTVRTPMYWDGSGVREMTSTQVTEWQDRAIYEYSLSPSVILSIVGGGGNLSGITDTRTSAGAFSSSVSAFPSEGTTAEPGTISVTYDRVTESRTSSGSIGQTGDTGTSFPVFSSGDIIQAMNLADLLDTFIKPAVDKMVITPESNTTAGTYTISSSSSVGGYTLVSGTPVFSDTRANTGAYSAGGIPESLDQPTTITNYYLHRRNGSIVNPSVAPMFATSGGDLQQYSASGFASLLGDWLRYTAAHDTGDRIIYSVSGSGNNRGSNMSNTKLNGSGAYTQRFVNANDYRAQEFPNGSAVVNNIYHLRIRKG